jgi:hypothetical protein
MGHAKSSVCKGLQEIARSIANSAVFAAVLSQALPFFCGL